MEYVFDFCSNQQFKLETTKKIGILGGTFNPVHLGHIEIAKHIREEFALEYVLMIPTGNPPHKKYDVADKKDRLNMLKISTQDYPFLKVCDLECDRVGMTYTIDTLISLEKKDSTYYYIIGSDTLLDLETWKESQKVFKLCNFVCVRRDNTSHNLIANEILRLKNAYDAKIHVSSFQGPDISSTLIRKYIESDKNVSDMIDFRVEEYIAKNGLYKE